MGGASLPSGSVSIDPFHSQWREGRDAWDGVPSLPASSLQSSLPAAPTEPHLRPPLSDPVDLFDKCWVPSVCYFISSLQVNYYFRLIDEEIEALSGGVASLKSKAVVEAGLTRPERGCAWPQGMCLEHVAFSLWHRPPYPSLTSCSPSLEEPSCAPTLSAPCVQPLLIILCIYIFPLLVIRLFISTQRCTPR